MNYNPEAVFEDSVTGKVLCFTHAVQAAMKGHYITIQIDEFGEDGNDMRTYRCQECDTETLEGAGDE